MNVMKRLVPVGLAAGALAAAAAPVKVIFDTDMLTDFDDVGAPKGIGVIGELMMRGPKLAASQGARAGKQERARP